MIKRLISCLTFFALTLTLVAPVAHGVQSNPFQQQNEFLPVDQAFDFDSEIDGDKITVS